MRALSLVRMRAFARGDEAIHLSRHGTGGRTDCFASLAMTREIFKSKSQETLA
jgi:hypothetical protein